MGRMYGQGKGISGSVLPYVRSVPNWLKLTADDVQEQIIKLAKKGLMPSQIGVILRDSHGVAQVTKITRTLSIRGLICSKNTVFLWRKPPRGLVGKGAVCYRTLTRKEKFIYTVFFLHVPRFIQ